MTDNDSRAHEKLSNCATEDGTGLLFRKAPAGQGADGAATSPANARAGSESHVAPKGRELLLARARASVARRKRRALNFNSAMFGEPAWDMLLALYTAEAGASRIAVTGLTKLSGAPPTTALRWLDYLAKERMVMREPHPVDRRLTYVSLTDKGRQALDAHFDDPGKPASEQHCE